MLTIDLTQKVVARLVAQAEQEIVHGCQRPGEMSRMTYLMLQARVEAMELDVARGQDCVEGFEAERGEIEILMAAAPWTMHPDYGCVLRSAVAALDREAGGGWDALKVQVSRNADYGGRAEDATLSMVELQAMTAMVDEGLRTTNGDAGKLEVSTRQLALLLNAAVDGVRHERG